MITASTHAIELIHKLGGTFRTSELLRLGVHPRTLYTMRDRGLLEQLSRGTYRLTEHGSLSNPDMVTVAARVPQAVICLISALSFHEMTTQIPHTVSIAIARTMRTPVIYHPPLTVYRYDEQSYRSGVEEHLLDGSVVRIYCPEKTLADCFKFRNKIGMDIVIEALKRYRDQKQFNIGEIMKYAAICRVTNVMKPYLESLL